MSKSRSKSHRRESRIEVRRFCSAAALALSLLLAVTSPAWAGVELEARYWVPDVGGGGALDLDGLPVDLDLGQDLGLEVDEAIEGRLTIRPGAGFFFRARYQNLAAQGSETVDLGVSAGGINLQILVDTESTLDYDYAGVALGWQFRNPQQNFRIGPFVEAKGVQGDAAITVSVFGQSQGLVEDFEAGFLSVGALMEIEPSDRWQVFAEYSVLVEDDEADLTDAEVGVRFFPNETVGLGVGFRSLQIEGAVDNVLLDLEYEGAFATVLFRF